MDHPRLYWTIHCTPGSEWARFTPIDVPRDRVWTAKDDARYLSPWIGLPGGKHTLGLARHWHFGNVVFWVGNGAIFYFLLFATGQWRRIVPTSWHVVPDAWATFVHYATLQGGQNYDSQPLETVLHPQTMLAYEMNFAPLAELHGAPLRLRVENQLGFKMVKWISAVEFVEDVKRIYMGEGGYNEDNEFFNSTADV